MNKTITLIFSALVAALAIALAPSTLAQAKSSPFLEQSSIQPPAPTVGLSSAEQEALIYMREEEKLAYDVYQVLYSNWGLPVFQNIASAELTHANAIKALMDQYGLVDTASTKAGVFTNPELQTLYMQLAARGSKSIGDALAVGAAIEEIDILDLEKQVDITGQADIQRVFNNLIRASYNHLQAFARLWEMQTDEIYQPQYLSSADFQSIINSRPAGRGMSLQQAGAGQGTSQAGGFGRGRGRAGNP